MIHRVVEYVISCDGLRLRGVECSQYGSTAYGDRAAADCAVSATKDGWVRVTKRCFISLGGTKKMHDQESGEVGRELRASVSAEKGASETLDAVAGLAADQADYYLNNATEALRASDPQLAMARAQIAIALTLQRIADGLDDITYDRGDGSYYLKVENTQ